MVNLLMTEPKRRVIRVIDGSNVPVLRVSENVPKQTIAMKIIATKHVAAAKRIAAAASAIVTSRIVATRIAVATAVTPKLRG